MTHVMTWEHVQYLQESISIWLFFCLNIFLIIVSRHAELQSRLKAAQSFIVDFEASVSIFKPSTSCSVRLVPPVTEHFSEPHPDQFLGSVPWETLSVISKNKLWALTLCDHLLLACCFAAPGSALGGSGWWKNVVCEWVKKPNSRLLPEFAEKVFTNQWLPSARH